MMEDWLGRIVDLHTNSGITITGYFVKPKDNIWFTGEMDIVDYRTISQDENDAAFSLNGIKGDSVIQIDSAVFGNVTVDENIAYVNILPFEILIGAKFDPAKILSYSFSLPELDNFFFQNIVSINTCISDLSHSISLKPMVSSMLTESGSDSSVEIYLNRVYQFQDSRNTFTIRSDNRIIVEPNTEFEINEIIQFVACITHFFSFILMEHVNLPSEVHVFFESDSVDYPESTQLLINDNRRYYTQYKKEPAKILFSDIKEYVVPIWANWVQFWNRKKNQPLIKLYSDVISYKSVGSNRYLNICHALEHYSRIYREKEAEKVRKEKGEEYLSLCIRFIDLIRAFNDFFDLKEKEIELISGKLAKKRNYLSHYNYGKSKPATEINHFEEMRIEYDLENFAFRLFMVVVYNELQVPKEIIEIALSRSENTFTSTLEQMFNGPREEEE